MFSYLLLAAALADCEDGVCLLQLKGELSTSADEELTTSADTGAEEQAPPQIWSPSHAAPALELTKIPAQSASFKSAPSSQHCPAPNCIDGRPTAMNKGLAKRIGCKRGTTSCMSTAADDNFLTIDLGAVKDVARVEVEVMLNYLSPLKIPLGDHEVWVSDTSWPAGPAATRVGKGTATTEEVVSYDCAVAGRYITVVLPGPGRILALNEVTAFERAHDWQYGDAGLWTRATWGKWKPDGLNLGYAAITSQDNNAFVWSEYAHAGQPVVLTCGSCWQGQRVWGPEQVQQIFWRGNKQLGITFQAPKLWPPPTDLCKPEEMFWCAVVPRAAPDTDGGSNGTDAPVDIARAYVVAAPEPFVRAVVPDVRMEPQLPGAMAACCSDASDLDSNPVDACPGRGSDTVCGHKADNSIQTRVTWRAAKQLCESRGWRLCTQQEVHDQELSGLGLSTEDVTGKKIGVDVKKKTIVVWTSTPADPCGNGLKAEYEQCDDGNLDSGDGCNEFCLREPSFRCVGCIDQTTGGANATSCCIATDPLTDLLYTKLDAHQEAFAMLSRAAVNAQTHVDELNRVSGGSGVYASRHKSRERMNLREWERTTYVDQKMGPCGLHNHADHINTVGMADCGVVLNGFHFRTRHNDYSLNRPVHDKTKFNEGTPLAWPAVPPSVTGSVADQVQEMRKWFKSWMKQDEMAAGSKREYKTYFTPQLCYIEGWLQYATKNGKLDDPFVSERHALESATWHDLMDQIRQRLMSGEKSILENGAYLPQIIVDVDADGMPVRGNFQYSIKCHGLQEDGKPMDLPFKRMRPVRDLHTTLSPGRRALYEIDPLCSKSYKAKPRLQKPFSATSNQKRACFRANTAFHDELMSQIPGKDNYEAEIMSKTNFVGDFTGEKVPINMGYYNRGYTSMQKDANGVTDHARGFSDHNLFVAETTNEKVVEFKGSYDKGRRFSWAIPFEIMYLTPLKHWNPHGIKVVGKGGNPGCEKKPCGCPDGAPNVAGLKQCAWDSVQHNNYYITPAELFSGEYDGERDPADTSGGFQWVLDKDGVPRQCATAGVGIWTNPVEGTAVRQRYPVMPRHEEGSPIWKELQLVKALLRRKDAYEDDGKGSAAAFKRTAQNTFPFGPEDASQSLAESGSTFRRRLFADDHEHEVLLSPDDRAALDQGRSVKAATTAAQDGHSHTVTVGPSKDDPDDHTVGAAEFPAMGEPELQSVDGVAGGGGHELGEEEPVAVQEPVEPAKGKDDVLQQLLARLDAQDAKIKQQQDQNDELRAKLGMA